MPPVTMDVPSNAPTRRTLTFLFTDIEQSSPPRDSRPDDMRISMELHDRMFSRVVKERLGRIFLKTGDGIWAVFDGPNDAIQAGIDVQRALRESPAPVSLSVRMAIHSGVVHEKDGAYDGEPLNRLSRILGFAQGGQILISRAAVALGAATPADQVVFRDLGSHPLRGLAIEENIYQVLHPALSSEPPAILPVRAAGRLPIPLTTFIGRHDQIGHVSTLISESRMVTLIGAGGIGKTRLAIEAAAGCSGEFSHGVWFIDLQNVEAPERVLPTFASALAVQETAGQELIDAIRHRIGSRKLLLVVDNCEQILSAAADAVISLLAIAPRVHVLATSREVLGIEGERVVRVQPLTIPTENQRVGARGTEAVRLFVDRALRANPSFRVTDSNLPLLCRLTAQLGGLPLAVELAAARMRSLSIEQLVERLDDTLALLRSPVRDETPRHQTLLATMEWSYRLLSPEEQVLFIRLGVFAGTWGIEDCEDICCPPPLARGQILDLLSSLVDKSLVVAEEWRGLMRYRLLETIRAYARSQLAKTEDAEAIREQFFRTMRRLAKRLDEGIRGHDQLKWRRVFDLEFDNFRAALDWAIPRPEWLNEAAELLCDLAGTWRMNGEFSQARTYFDRISEALPAEQYRLRALVLSLSGLLRARAGNRNSIELLRKAVEIAEMADRRTLIHCIDRLATTTFEQGDFDEAEQLFHREIELAAQPPPLPEGYVRLALGALATERGEFEIARGHYEIMFEEKAESGDIRGAGLALCYLAHLETKCGRTVAESLYRDAIAYFARVPDYMSLAANLAAASAILVDTCPEDAAQIQGFADQLADRVGAALDPHIAQLASKAKELTRESLGPHEYATWYEEGKFADLEAVLDMLNCPEFDRGSDLAGREIGMES